jgi:hypothetical protein
MDDEFAADIFEDRAVTRSVSERKVAAGFFFPPGKSGATTANGSLLSASTASATVL